MMRLACYWLLMLKSIDLFCFLNGYLAAKKNVLKFSQLGDMAILPRGSEVDDPFPTFPAIDVRLLRMNIGIMATHAGEPQAPATICFLFLGFILDLSLVVSLFLLLFLSCCGHFLSCSFYFLLFASIYIHLIFKKD